LILLVLRELLQFSQPPPKAGGSDYPAVILATCQCSHDMFRKTGEKAGADLRQQTRKLPRQQQACASLSASA
jgi:hypothetical protein